MHWTWVGHSVKCIKWNNVVWNESDKTISSIRDLNLNLPFHFGACSFSCRGQSSACGGLGSRLPSKFSPDLPAPWIIISVLPKLIFHCSLNNFCCFPALSRICGLLLDYSSLLFINVFSWNGAIVIWKDVIFNFHQPKKLPSIYSLTFLSLLR